MGAQCPTRALKARCATSCARDSWRRAEPSQRSLGTVNVRGADAVTILIAARTSFVNYQNANGNPELRVKKDIEAAASKSYESIAP